MKAALYCRVSTEEQAKSGYSIRQQLEALHEYCQQNNYDVVGEFQDSSSGADIARLGLDDLRDLVAVGGIDIALAQDADRITRDPAHRAYLDDEFESHGTRLVALDDWGDDTHEGELLKYLRGWVSKGERLKIGERGRRGRAQKARDGLVPGSGPAPYGFRYDRDKRTYVIDEEKMVWVRKIFDLVADGKSLYEVARYLQSVGAPSPRGGQWHRFTIRNMILRDSYAGTYYWGKEKRTYFNVTEIENGEKVYKRRSTREIRPRTEWIGVQVPDSGILPETIARARERVESNVTWKPSNNDGLTWELSSGVAVCGECGHRLRTCNQSNAKRKRYHYYSCPQAKDICSHTKLHRKKELEQEIGERLADMLEDSSWESLVNKTFDQKIKDLEDMRRGSPSETRARLYKQLGDLQGKMTRVEDLYFNEAISRERFDSKKLEIDTQVATIRAEMDELEDIDETIQVAEESRRFLLDNRYILFGGGPVTNWIATHALFAPHKYLPQEVQEHWDWITPEKRQEFYRRMNLKVKVYQDDEPILEISGVPVCQNARSRSNSSR
jgi:site-specific DNA recombinase